MIASMYEVDITYLLEEDKKETRGFFFAYFFIFPIYF